MSEDSTEMELIQRINELFTKFVLLDITHEEFCIMKLINFLNHGELKIELVLEYQLGSFGGRYDMRAGRIWIMHAYGQEHMINHYAYAPVSYRPAKELGGYGEWR